MVMIGCEEMKKFHITSDPITKETVLGYMVYDTKTQKEITQTIYKNDGTPFINPRDFLTDYVKSKDFIRNYSDIKTREPKDAVGLKLVTNEDYYEFKPKENKDKAKEAEKFLLIVDRDIKDYALVTADIEDAKLTIKMNQSKETRHNIIKNLRVSMAAVAVSFVMVNVFGYATMYAANGYQEPKQVLVDMCNVYDNMGIVLVDTIHGKSQEEISTHLNEVKNNREVEKENNVKTR